MASNSNLSENCIRRYKKILHEQRNPYEMWIAANEKSFVKEKTKTFEAKCCEKGFVLFYDEEGTPIDSINDIIDEAFADNKEVGLIYGDEDVVLDGKRVSPWFKPDFSPDTLESFFYFGSFVAVRKDIVLATIESEENSDSVAVANYCRFLKGYITEDRIIRISMKYNALEGPNNWAFFEEFIRCVVKTDSCKVLHDSRILFHRSCEEPFSKKISHHIYDVPARTKASIIIPSKDNPRMLGECISSIKRVTRTSIEYEIVVVDNGSNEDNRVAIEALKKEYGFKYSYENMEFNFSRMCNKGAAISGGEVLIFMNDDITVRTKEWLDIMCGQALRAMTGAVGAKLYYPDSTVIQHAGITNMGVGPAHKLGGMDDKGNESLYHARNLADYNVYAVTAALLAISREKFFEIDGFDPLLQVAYNDVDLCFTLYERGYYNVVRNDVHMTHHESVSRGSDDSPQKKERLKRERAILYKKHDGSICKDPFYNKNLVQFRLDGDYNVEYIYPHEDMNLKSDVKKIGGIAENILPITRKLMRKGPLCTGCVDRSGWVSLEGRGAKLSDTDAMIFEIEGWASLTDDANCNYKRYLVLEDENGQWHKVSIFDKYREDVAAVVPMQRYHHLSGFTARVHLPNGKYKAWMRFESIISDKAYNMRFLNGESQLIIKID